MKLSETFEIQTDPDRGRRLRDRWSVPRRQPYHQIEENFTKKERM